MKSPFPGMDPYLELWWRDVHHRLCTYACDAIQNQLGSALRARIDERLIVETDEVDRSIYPDVRVLENPQRGDREVQPVGGLALADEVVVQIETRRVRQAFINILEPGSGDRLVTSIEFLSPSNKVPGDGRKQYLRKQRQTYRAGASLVEIDLVRAGKRPTLARKRLSPRRDSTYQVCIFRPWRADECRVVRIPLNAKLPTIPIPLRKTDAEIEAALAAPFLQARTKPL
jgi:hypothetical protein